MNKIPSLALVFATTACLLTGLHTTAHGADIVSVEPVPADAPGAVPVALEPAQLEELVGPVALYPDDLLAVVLPASTYPLDIVQAARFLERRDTDATAEPDENWDESVIALLNYPEVVALLDSDLDWTWTLGEAVLYQEEDLIAAVERFRERAFNAGNLNSDARQDVIVDEGAISITPASSEVIYVPYYEPHRVVVRSRAPVVYYYPRPYPVYYYPYPANHHFNNGLFWGVSTAFHISFRSRGLRLHHYSYASHPYFGRRYFPGFYRFHRYHFSAPAYRQAYRASYRSSYKLSVRSRSYHGDRWQGSYRTGVRPREYNDQNYPRRHASRPRTSQHRAVGSQTRSHTRLAPSTNASRRTTSGSSSRQLTTGRATQQHEAARHIATSASTRTQVSSTRRTTAFADTRETARAPAGQRQTTRYVTSREDNRRSAQVRDARPQTSRAATPPRNSRATPNTSQQRRSAAPEASRSGNDRAQSRQRNSNNTSNAGRSSPSPRPDTRSRNSSRQPSNSRKIQKR